MTRQERNKIVELALIRGIPDMIIGTINEGRLKKLYKKLIKEIDIQLKTLTKPTGMDIYIIGNKLEKFGIDTGWNGKKKHVVTIISFCLDMIERSDSVFTKKTVFILNDLFDYFERINEFKYPSLWGGRCAAEKWVKIISENNDSDNKKKRGGV